MRLRYMLDTNICIYIAKNRPDAVLKRFQQLSVGEVAMSVITTRRQADLRASRAGRLKTKSGNAPRFAPLMVSSRYSC